MVEYGYARVSTADQSLGLQLDALTAAGVPAENITREHASGVRSDRPALGELLSRLGERDRLSVWRLDRLARSTRHLLELTDELQRRGVAFRSLRDSIDTTTPTGRFFFTVTSALAELEADLTRERTRAGLAAAKSSGKRLGRPSALTPVQARHVRQLLALGYSHRQAADSMGISRAVVGRVARGEVAGLVPNLDGVPDLLDTLARRPGDQGTHAIEGQGA